MTSVTLASQLLEERERFRLLVDGVKDYEASGCDISLFYTPDAVESRHPRVGKDGFTQLLMFDGLRSDQRDGMEQIQRAGEHLLALEHAVRIVTPAGPWADIHAGTGPAER